MKNLNELLNESILNEGYEWDIYKDFEIDVTSDIVDMINNNRPLEIKQFNTEDFDEYSISVDTDSLVGLRDMFSWFAGLVKKAYIKDLGINWNPTDCPFQEIADLDDNDHGFVLSGDDEDDGTFSIFLFRRPLNAANKKKFEEFVSYFKNSRSIYISELF